MKSAPWTNRETVKLCGLYTVMLNMDKMGLLGRKKHTQTSKATLIREFVQDVVPTRTKGSVEAKMMNLAAARREMGLPLLRGFVCLPNMSKSCRYVAVQYWSLESSMGNV